MLTVFESVRVVAYTHRDCECFHAPNRGHSTDHEIGSPLVSNRAIQPQGRDLPSGYNAVMRALEVFPICGVAKHTFTTHASACVMDSRIIAAVREIHLLLHLGGCVFTEKDLSPLDLSLGRQGRSRGKRQEKLKIAYFEAAGPCWITVALSSIA
jgi:hypothetical protein